MKLYFCIALMIGAVVVHADAFKMWKGGCKNESDCSENECCLKQFSSYGQCLKRPQLGERCVMENKFNTMFQQATCPCADGLECSKGEKSKVIGMKYGLPPMCREIPDVTEQPEES